MINLVQLAQLIVSISVIYVWIFKYDNIVAEFLRFGLSGLVRNLAGVAKISLATLLVAGIWYPEFVLPSSLAMAFMMLTAQYFHSKASSYTIKRIPSFILLVLSLFIAFNSY